MKSDIGIISSLGPTRTGTLFYNLLAVDSKIYVAKFDSTSGQLSSLPMQPIQQFKGFNASPEWSSDGRYLAYASRRDVPAPINVTRSVTPILSMATGQVVRELHPSVTYGGIGRWSPDGRQFIARGVDAKGRSGIVAVDATDGSTTLVILSETCTGIPFWATDGKSFFCYRFTERQIAQVDVAAGTILRTFPADNQGFAASPEGRHVVYGTLEGDQTVLKLLILASGETRDILRLPSASSQIRATTVDWTPDNSAVVLYGRLNGDEAMWLVPIDGRAPHKINVGV